MSETREPDSGDSAERSAIVKARTHLRATLGQWKDGTRPGDKPIREVDVMHAIAGLVDAMIAHHELRGHDRAAGKV